MSGSGNRECGAHVWRCPGCDKSVAKAIVRQDGRCPRGECVGAGRPFESTCRNRIGPDAIRCHEHAGKAPQVLAKTDRRAARREAEGELGKLLEEMGEQPIPHPLDGLEAAYAKAARWVAALNVLVGALPTPLGVNRFEEQVVHPLVVLHGEWLDRYVRIQKVALDAGLDQRRQELDEADVAYMFEMVARALVVADLTSAQQEAFRRALATELRGPTVVAVS